LIAEDPNRVGGGGNFTGTSAVLSDYKLFAHECVAVSDGG
jgi:hypothetical protein